MKKHCTNRGCSLRSMAVETDKTECVGCSKPLVSAVGSLFGDPTAATTSDLFGKIYDDMEAKKRERQESFLDMVDEELRKRK